MKKEIVWPRGCQSAAMICVMLDAEFIWLSMDAQRMIHPSTAPWENTAPSGAWTGSWTR